MYLVIASFRSILLQKYDYSFFFLKCLLSFSPGSSESLPSNNGSFSSRLYFLASSFFYLLHSYLSFYSSSMQCYVLLELVSHVVLSNFGPLTQTQFFWGPILISPNFFSFISFLAGFFLGFFFKRTFFFSKFP